MTFRTHSTYRYTSKKVANRFETALIIYPT